MHHTSAGCNDLVGHLSVSGDQFRHVRSGLQESMRLMPVVAVATIRVSHKDCTLGGGKCAFRFA